MSELANALKKITCLKSENNALKSEIEKLKEQLDNQSKEISELKQLKMSSNRKSLVDKKAHDFMKSLLGN